MSVIRVEKNKDYTVISNLCFKEKNMSLKAKGLLTFMLSLPEDWDYSVTGLVLLCKENESSIKSALKELEKFGYLKREIVRNNGKFEDMEYIIYEKPQNGNKPCESQVYKETTQKIYYPVDIEQKNEEDETKNNLSLYIPQAKKPLAENPPAENSLAGNPLVENRTQQNIYKQNTNKQNTKITNITNKPKSLFVELIDEYTNNKKLKEALSDFVKMRVDADEKNKNKNKIPFSATALKVAFGRLNKLAKTDEEKIELLDQSILRGWKGIFPISEYKNKSSPKNQIIDYENGDIKAEDFE